MMMGIGIGLIVLETVILLSGHWLTLILGLLSGGTGYGLCEWLSHQVAVQPPERDPGFLAHRYRTGRNAMKMSSKASC